MKNKELLLFLLVIGVTAVFIYVYLPGYSKYHELKAKEDRLLYEIEALAEQNAGINREITLLKTDVEYLEKVMRNEMGLVKPGEVVYKIVEEEPQEGKNSSDKII